jgi:hypothetical protein
LQQPLKMNPPTSLITNYNSHIDVIWQICNINEYTTKVEGHKLIYHLILYVS